MSQGEFKDEIPLSLSLNEKRLGMIGLGRLGLCIALCFEQAGWSVVGSDVSSDLVKSINERTHSTCEPEVEKMIKAHRKLHATTETQKVLDHAELIYISVPTPTTNEATYDTKALGEVLISINASKARNKHLVIISTVMPGYIRDIARYLLKDCVGTTISYVPDGAVPISYGNLIQGLTEPIMVIIGEGSKEAGDLIEKAHASIIRNGAQCKRMSTTSAEIAKLSVSMMCASKIAVANFISDVAESTEDANAQEILECLGHDSRLGSAFMTPGLGFGGPCIPRDTRGMAEYAQKQGVHPLIPRAVIQANDEHLDIVADRLIAQIKAGSGSNIVLRDIAFKENSATDVIDESRKLLLAEKLADSGVDVTLRDEQSLLDLAKAHLGGKVKYEAAAKDNNASGSPGGQRSVLSRFGKLEVRQI